MIGFRNIPIRNDLTDAIENVVEDADGVSKEASAGEFSESDPKESANIDDLLDSDDDHY